MHSLIYGIGTGVALIAFSLIMYVANQYMNQTLGYIAFLIIAVVVIAGDGLTAINGTVVLANSTTLSNLAWSPEASLITADRRASRCGSAA